MSGTPGGQQSVRMNLNATVFALAHIMWRATLGLLVPRLAEAELRVRTT